MVVWVSRPACGLRIGFAMSASLTYHHSRRRGRSWARATIRLLGPEVPSGVRRLLEALRDARGRPYLVGGAVRDPLLGRPHKGLDIEVFGLPLPRLKEAPPPGGRVDA